MVSLPPEYDAFLDAHRWAVLTTLRRSGAPVSSVVAYAREGAEFVVSTPGGTFKRRSIDADARVNLTTLSNSEPFNFVAVEGRAVVQTGDVLASTRKVFAAIADTGWEEPDDMQGWLTAQKRVILRITAERVTGVIR